MFRNGHQVPRHEIIEAHTIDVTTDQPHQSLIEEIDKDDSNLVLCCSLSSMCLAKGGLWFVDHANYFGLISSGHSHSTSYVLYFKVHTYL